MQPVLTDLRTMALWRGFSDGELAEVAALCRPVPAGQVLFRAGDAANALYLMTAGEVVLDRPGDDLYRLRPPALIGELGALSGLPRTSTATASADAEIWIIDAKALQGLLADNQELGVRFLINLLDLVADKVQRDQRRIADLRGTVKRTQKELKALRELVLDSPETPVSEPVHDALDRLIATNRRVNYRVEPPTAMAATFATELGVLPVLEIARTHLAVQWKGTPPAPGSWHAGIASLAGTDVPMSGTAVRVEGARVTLELDLLIDESAQAFEGYLTRVQLLDVLV